LLSNQIFNNIFYFGYKLNHILKNPLFFEMILDSNEDLWIY